MTKIVTTQAAELVATDLQTAFDAFDQAAARFLASRKSQHTAASYAPGLHLIRDLAQAAGVDPLRADALIIFNASLQERRRDKGGDLANGTIRLRMYAVQKFFSWAWAFNLTPLKPELVRQELLKNKPPARQLSPRDILEPEEVQRLLDAAEDPQSYCLMRVLADAGPRISEALALRLGDIYPATGRYWLHIAHGKGDKARTIDVEPIVYRDLAAYTAGLGLDISDPRLIKEELFTISRATAWRWVKAAARDAGIERHVTPHSFRHTHAHHLRMAGYPLEAIAYRLGHSSTAITDRYTQPATMIKGMELPRMPWNSET